MKNPLFLSIKILFLFVEKQAKLYIHITNKHDNTRSTNNYSDIRIKQR